MERQQRWVDATGPDGDASHENAGLLAIAWRQKWLLLVLTSLGGGLGYLYFLRCPPVFQSSAQVLIIKKESALPVQGAEIKSGYDDSLALHSLLLKSPTIAAKAIEKHHLASLASFRDAPDPLGMVVGGIGVDCKTSGGASVVTLTFKGAEAEDCPKVLDALLTTYQAFLGETYQNSSEETAQLISQAKDVLLKQLQDKEEVYRNFRQNAPLLWKGDLGANLHESRMAEIEATRSHLMVEQSQTKSKIDSLESALKKGKRDAIALLVANWTTMAAPNGSSDGSPAKINTLSPFQNATFATVMEEQLLLEEYGADHPKVKAVQKKLELLRKELGDDTLEKHDPRKPLDIVAVYLDSLRQEFDLQQERIQGLGQLFEKERDSAKKLSEFQLTDESLRNGITRTQQLFTTVIKRLDEINLIKDAGGVRTTVVSAPKVGHQVEPRFSAVVGLGCFLGAMSGFGLGWLRERLDTRIRAPEEIRAMLGAPILGHIPLVDLRAASQGQAAAIASMSPLLCVAHRPKCVQAEAYRAVRTAIYFSANAEGQKIFQVTSPGAGDGKTTTAVNLGLCIAESGKKVLIVDADFRRPRVHKMLGIENERGLWDVIEREMEIPDAVQPGGVENLSVITTGGRPSNPAEILTSSRFKDFLDAVREVYDFVIIDTPPVLAVTDACAVAPRVDGVILVLRLTKSSRHTAAHAAEALTSLGVKLVGVVVNAVTSGSSYGYGVYKYGYGSHYKYSYNYHYNYGYGHADESPEASQGEDSLENTNGNSNGAGKGGSWRSLLGRVGILKNGHGNGKPAGAAKRNGAASNGTAGKIAKEAPPRREGDRHADDPSETAQG
ncbi:MAG: polysaccharide biosynthesis tyrosine autokinase [Thermoguttaceae bacterium]|jgi:capsular exopolysaccharide synthesis family protein